MLITRTPLRISLGGGGTDVGSYYQQFGGFVIAAAITKYIYIGINRTFTDDYFLKYADLERASSVEHIRHPIIREALRMQRPGPGLEIVSLADIPAGTGLGSSSTFTVGLLRALYEFKREYITALELAEQACRIEIDRLGQRIGKQDQYIASVGGITKFVIGSDERVHTKRLDISNQTLHNLEEHLLLFFTGYSRDANRILQEQESDVEHLHQIARIGYEIEDALKNDDLYSFGEYLHEHWEHKRARSSATSNSKIDEWYKIGRANGAVGGKLVGAGGGGFLLFYADDPKRLRSAMQDAGLTELRFGFDFEGSTIMVRD